MLSLLPTPVCCIYLPLIYDVFQDFDHWSNFLAWLWNVSPSDDYAACNWLPSLPQGGNTIRQLLKIAKKTVPEEDWKRTPVVLKATAGLRLLPEDKANALLKEVRHAFSLCPQTVWHKHHPSRQGAGWETTKCLQVSLKKRQHVCPFVSYHVAKNSCCGVVWSNHICQLKY